jgi:hypothetical protein
VIGSDAGVICHSSSDKVCGLLSFRAESSTIWRGHLPGVEPSSNGSRSRQMFAPVRTLKLQDRAKGNNARRIDVIVRNIIMTFDVIEIDDLRNAHCRHP